MNLLCLSFNTFKGSIICKGNNFLFKCKRKLCVCNVALATFNCNSLWDIYTYSKYYNNISIKVILDYISPFKFATAEKNDSDLRLIWCHNATSTLSKLSDIFCPRCFNNLLVNSSSLFVSVTFENVEGNDKLKSDWKNIEGTNSWHSDKDAEALSSFVFVLKRLCATYQ